MVTGGVALHVTTGLHRGEVAEGGALRQPRGIGDIREGHGIGGLLQQVENVEHPRRGPHRVPVLAHGRTASRPSRAASSIARAIRTAAAPSAAVQAGSTSPLVTRTKWSASIPTAP